MAESTARVGRENVLEAVPPGRRRNPSALPERSKLMGLALAGLGVATYLTLYQWRVLPDVWEPFFGDGSRRVLNSSLSRLLPIPDATFGALGYLCEAVISLIGGKQRSRTSPWVTVISGLVGVGMAFVAIGLTISQPVLAHGWCTLCLCSACISLAMAWPAVSEMGAGWGRLRSRSD